MKINAEIIENEHIVCKQENCRHRIECANNQKAGKFISEYGFTPQLTMKGKEFDCKTIERPTQPPLNQIELAGMISDHVPDNYESLWRGKLTLQDGKLFNQERETEIKHWSSVIKMRLSQDSDFLDALIQKIKENS